MGLITDKPEDLPSGNDLDNIEDPDEQQDEERGERAEIYLSGAHVATLDNAPGGLGRITLMVELEVTEVSVRFAENGETEVPIRRCKRIGDMWRPGEQRPPTKEELAAEQARAKAQAAREQAERDEAERAEAEQNEPPMFDEDGNPVSIDAPRPADDDDVVDAEVVDDEDEHQDADPDAEHGDTFGDDADNVVQFSDGSK